MGLNNMVKIIITNKDGEIISTNEISDKKAEHITNTYQWNDVMNVLLNITEEQ
jgi:hypothetical protein